LRRLRSRFKKFIGFPDYSADELAAILVKMCEDSDYVLDDTTRAKAAAVMKEVHGSRGKGFGNGRAVRNLFEQTTERAAAFAFQPGRMPRPVGLMPMSA